LSFEEILILLKTLGKFLRRTFEERMGGSVMLLLAMIFVQVGYAGMNISSKLAIQSGMHPLVLVAYRQIFATLSLAPFAYWFER